ncbi:nitrite reductase small subunit NirD [Streptomyces fuscigenes]|uniref:nitrite reductase small subunit NirD n=1 Tax=Streptomyces fuscigenes TaxID=1528880 RepID=UPI001F454A14|nr:nitrite reductase small subunit NirD [Streptomyces fuscigenes]MCF3960181.1 nitrite reductase small subunit NirD [Streptomyces fuscigenes]
MNQTSTAPATAADLVEIHDGARWHGVCAYDDLVAGRGVAVLLGTEQIALFKDRGGALWAVGNKDPFSGAHVLSRGLIGSRDGAPTLISPMYKQVFDLRDGRCVDEDTAPDGSPAALRVWPTRRAPQAGRATDAPFEDTTGDTP